MHSAIHNTANPTTAGFSALYAKRRKSCSVVNCAAVVYSIGHGPKGLLPSIKHVVQLSRDESHHPCHQPLVAFNISRSRYGEIKLDRSMPRI